MQLPREPQSGDKLDAAWGRQVVRYLRALTLLPGPGVMVRETGAGTTLSAAAGGGRRAKVSHPFQIVDASDGSSPKIRVVYGQVDSVTPTIAGIALSAEPAPELVVSSGLIVLRVNLTEEGWVDTAEIVLEAALPEDTETEGYLTLGEVTVSGTAVSAIHQSVTRSLGHQKCGETMHNFWGL